MSRLDGFALFGRFLAPIESDVISSLDRAFEGKMPSSVKGSALYNPAKGHGLWKPETSG